MSCIYVGDLKNGYFSWSKTSARDRWDNQHFSMLIDILTLYIELHSVYLQGAIDLCVYTLRVVAMSWSMIT